MRWIFTAITFWFLAVAVEANPVQFDTHSYNFALAGGGGTFCDNFNNEIDVPHTGYSAYLSTPTDGSDLSHTRFGSNSSWQTVTINDGDPNDAADAAVINGASALGRYQMAAFLVSEYQTNQGSNATNNGVQAAIWDIFDPCSSPAAPTYADAGEALEQAVDWYADPNATRSFLADFLIVSDSTMSWNGPGSLLVGGFQEQAYDAGSRAGASGLSEHADRFVLHFCLPASAGFCDKTASGAKLKCSASSKTNGYRSHCFHRTYETIAPKVPVLTAGHRTSTS